MGAGPGIRRLALLGAALLATGCATQSQPTASDDGVTPTGDSAQPELPVTARGVESCTKISQTSASAVASARRLLDINLQCLTDGPAVNPARLGGTPVVINLWATWCQPCRQEMPILQKAHERFGPRVQFLGVNTKDRPEWAAEFLQEVKVTYPQVVDSDGTLLGSLRSPGLPVTVVLDADGEVAGRQIGRISEQRLTDLVAEATQ